MGMLYPLPGRRFAFSSFSDAAHGVPATVDLIALGARHIISTAHAGAPDRTTARMRDWGRRVVKKLDIDLELRGLEHVDSAERYVVAPLHEGFIDVPALLHLPLNLRFVAREELAEWRILGNVIRETDQIVIETARPRIGYRQLFRGGEVADRAGQSVVVFPQGSLLGIEVAFQPGAAALARHLGRQVLPVVITGSHRVWEYPFSPRVRFGEAVTMEVLAPVTPEAFSALESTMKTMALADDRAPGASFRARQGWLLGRLLV